MKTSLLYWLCLPALLLACKKEPEPPAAVCRLTSATDYVVEASGSLSPTLQRTFLYRSDTLIGLREQTAAQIVTFATAHTGGRIVQIASPVAVIAFAFSSGGTTPPSSATYSQNGQVQSTFALEYTPAGMLSRLTERRQVLPVNSLIGSRNYTFTYDADNRLIRERATFTFRDGLTLDQQTDYTPGTQPSPYTRLAQRPLLTILALSRSTESLPSRFWHTATPTAYKTYDLNANGSTGTLRESTTYSSVTDEYGNPTTQDLTAQLYQASVPTPVTKRTRQAFTYSCD